MEDTPSFKTKDFYIACILLASKVQLLRIEKRDNKTAIFSFADSNHQAPSIISKHWNRELSLSTRELIESINELKTRMYSTLKS